MKKIIVKPGQSIWEAYKRAKPGQKIVVYPGIYKGRKEK